MRGLGELEAAVMDRLWEWDRPSTVREVLDDLNRDRNLAYTTVMTVMDNLHRKKWLTRELDGRAYRYQPVSSRQAYSAELMRQALDGSGDHTTTLLRFIGRMSDEELQAIRTALRQRRPPREQKRG